MNIYDLKKGNLELKPDARALPKNSYSIIFNLNKYKEFIITQKHIYALKIKGYSSSFNKKILHKNKIGNIIITLLNKSIIILELLENYKSFLKDNYTNVQSDPKSFRFFVVAPILSLLYDDLLEISPYTFIIIDSLQNSLFSTVQLQYIDYKDKKRKPENIEYFINEFLDIFDREIYVIKDILYTVDEIYKRTNTNKKGYVKYYNPIINIPKCVISYKKQGNFNKPYLYRYKISNLFELFNVSIYTLSLTNYKIYKCDICGRYFTSKKTRKTCNTYCENKSVELRKEKNRNRNLIKNSDDVTKLYRRIKNFYNKTVKNKHKQSLKDKMRRDFDDRYDKKITALNKQYKSPLDDRFQKQLLIWLEKEYIRIQETFPSKKFGNTNRSSS